MWRSNGRYVVPDFSMEPNAFIFSVYKFLNFCPLNIKTLQSPETSLHTTVLTAAPLYHTLYCGWRFSLAAISSTDSTVKICVNCCDWLQIVDKLGSVWCTCQTVCSYCRATCLSGWPTNFVLEIFSNTFAVMEIYDIYIYLVTAENKDARK